MDTLLHGYANLLKTLDTSESVNLHKCLILLDSCRIHATRWRLKGDGSSKRDRLSIERKIRVSEDVLLRFLDNGLIDIGRDDAKLERLQLTAGDLAETLKKTPGKA